MSKIRGIWTRRMAFVLAFVVVLAACSADDDDTTSVSDGDATDSATATSVAADSADDGADDSAAFATAETSAPAVTGQEASEEALVDGQALGSGGVPIGVTAAELGRDIIFTATIGGAEPRSEIIYKVRPDRFNEALNRLGEVGELRNQTITTDDVTERVVDCSIVKGTSKSCGANYARFRTESILRRSR